MSESTNPTAISAPSHIADEPAAVISKEERSLERSRKLNNKPRDLSKKKNRRVHTSCSLCRSWEERNRRGAAAYRSIDIDDASANGYISKTRMVSHAILELEGYEDSETDREMASIMHEIDSKEPEALLHSVSIMDILKPSRRRPRRDNDGFEIIPALRRVRSLEEFAELSDGCISEWEYVE